MPPAAPANRMMRMGLSLKTFTPKNAAMKSRMLMVNCRGEVSQWPKFSLFISSRAAAANSPTTAGRSPLKMAVTVG